MKFVRISEIQLGDLLHDGGRDFLRVVEVVFNTDKSVVAVKTVDGTVWVRGATTEVLVDKEGKPAKELPIFVRTVPNN